jgi:hypothetical protein
VVEGCELLCESFPGALDFGELLAQAGGDATLFGEWGKR